MACRKGGKVEESISPLSTIVHLTNRTEEIEEVARAEGEAEVEIPIPKLYHHQVLSRCGEMRSPINAKWLYRILKLPQQEPSGAN